MSKKNDMKALIVKIFVKNLESILFLSN